MSRVIAVLACGFSVAACSASMPNLNFFSSSPPTSTVRFESEPPGAEVKVSSGQACRTPCELSIQLAPELSAAFTLAGYQAQTVSLKSEESGGFGGIGSSARLSPNPVYAELHAVPVAPPKKKKKKPVIASRKPAAAPVASADATTPAAPPPMPATSNEAAASATNYPWPSR